jgi:heat shock protein HslJ
VSVRPRRRRWAPGLPLALAAVLLACGPTFPDDVPGGTLAGTSWVVIEIAGTTTIEERRPTLDFGADGRLTGTDGCDRYSLAVRIDGATLELGDGVTSGVGCDARTTAQAEAFWQVLRPATRWARTPEGHLELGERGELVAEAAAPPSPVGSEPVDAEDLTGTTWLLIDLGGSTDLLGTIVTLELGADGTVSGSGGCNEYHGAYAVDGGDLSIGPLASTKRGCPGLVGEVEATYLAALDAVGSWSIDPAGHLVLGGPTTLVFEPG